MEGYPPNQQDMVPGDQYRYALTNFRIAHEQVEQQRRQLEEQERQVAMLRARIATLEGSTSSQAKHGQLGKQGGSTVDDFSIKNTASKLERLINRWASDVTRMPPASLDEVRNAALWDIHDGMDLPHPLGPATAMEVQNLLRHALSKAVTEGIINCLIITDSSEANVQLTRVHEHIFARDPTVASVWRRQTFTAAIERPSPEMSQLILSDHLPALSKLLATSTQGLSSMLQQALQAAYDFSRMLHGSSGVADSFYQAFVPERLAQLDPHQVELVRRCARSERGEPERAGATIFPGLVKIVGPPAGTKTTNTQTIVRRAQVICECALMTGAGAPMGTPMGMPNGGSY